MKIIYFWFPVSDGTGWEWAGHEVEYNSGNEGTFSSTNTSLSVSRFELGIV